ncbi:hypothetical protein AMEJIAPC_02965 [Caulobacter sp. NIBR1757]|nr:hypothetical protein AMEJIAPC_02965 [Caulobacter sp. NIBR1757]
MLGNVIRTGRESIKDPKTGAHPTQAKFYALCREAEGTPSGLRAGYLFAQFTASSRRWMGLVERGIEPIKPGHARLFEKVCGWPEGILDAQFDSAEAFQDLLTSWGDRVVLPASFPSGLSDGAYAAGEDHSPVRLNGIKPQVVQRAALPTRKALAAEIDHGLRKNRLQSLRLVVVQGEQGIGKSQLIAQWWNEHGKDHFDRNTFTLDCARLGGDQIVVALNDFFLRSKPTAELTPALPARLKQLSRLLIVLDGLSQEQNRPHPRPADDRQESPIPAGRADSAAFNRVREFVLFLAQAGVRASVLLGVQTAEKTGDALGISGRLDASTGVEFVSPKRLSPEEGALLFQALEVGGLSLPDLQSLSARLQGLPISITAAAHYLREANAVQAEAFLTDIAKAGDFQFFDAFFERYLQAINSGAVDPQAHPHAYLRLLALMPGPVAKSRLDDLLAKGRIRRLQNGDTGLFERMRIAFVIDQDSHIDINPMVRSLLRQELARHVRESAPGVDRDRAELRWIHATAAISCHSRLPLRPSDYTIAEIEMIEGVLYHLLAVRDLLDEPQPGAAPDEDLRPLEDLLAEPLSPAAITRFCLEKIVRRYLMDRRTHRVTRILGQFETKARLLGLFFDGSDDGSGPRHLDVWDQVDLYGEIGVCWMHAGRLKLAHEALAKAMRCFQRMGLTVTQDSFPLLEGTQLRLWSETLSTYSLVQMRMGRTCSVVEDMLSPAVAVGARFARAVLVLDKPLDDEGKAKLRSARRLICRDAYVKFRAGDLDAALDGYGLALAIEKLGGGDKLSGDALRRYIEAKVRRGPCIPEDLLEADALIDRHLEHRRSPTAARRGSNDVISLYATKIMLQRALSNFAEAGAILEEALRHPFVQQGECSYVARIELELERYRLLIAQNAATPEAMQDLKRIVQDLEARHHGLLQSDAMLVLAEMEAEPDRSRTLSILERRMLHDGWSLRRGDVDTIRRGDSAVKSWGC